MSKENDGMCKHIANGHLPRFSRPMHRYLNISGTEYKKPINIWSYNINVIKEQKEDEEEKLLQKSPTFSELCNIINESKNEVILKNLNMLYAIAQKLSKDKEPEIISSAVLFFFKLLIGVSVLLMKHILELRRMFGNVPNNSGNQIFKLIKEIEILIDDKTLNNLKILCEESDNHKTNNKKNKDSIYFADIELLQRYKQDFQLWIPPKFAKLPFPDYGLKMSSTIFTMTYNEEERRNHTSIIFGKTWLLKQITKTSLKNTGVSDEDYFNSIINILSTQKPDTEIRDNLFNLLGSIRITLIETLLKHRKDILKQCYVTDEKHIFFTNLKNISRHMEMINIETKEDKLLKKDLKKEEKACHQINCRQDSDSDDESLKIISKTTNAANVPTFIDPKNIKEPLVENYPYVFDNNYKTKVSSCYIGKKSCVVPAGAIRTDHKTYEEVYIPVTKMTQELTVGNKLIAINTLDKVGQKAFHGITNLNRIQSVVFDAAYNTNDNLLVCAPTGAGKTNIALLTIVHQIKQFIRNNKINKNKFKIVYIAPMKALAAEMTANFSKRLSSLGIEVLEFTGDMLLTKTEMIKTQILVTTPEKWDVVTRKGNGDIALTSLVKLLIIDEVHLLHGDRGPVLEALVARTLRQVESSQSIIRIVGLSATLPNYKDIARFLRIDFQKGLFYFDGRFRPVPLAQTFIGVRGSKTTQIQQEMDLVCYQKVYDMVQKGHQVMVFVHSRNATVTTANMFKKLSTQKSHQSAFQPQDSIRLDIVKKEFEHCYSKELRELLNSGLSVHHAGLLRSDRNLVEKYFAEGAFKVLVCTATLSWGVNLPAHAVIIKGTEVYDFKLGKFIDLGMLDVLQIFGRAGRPQFDTSGHGMIITPHSKLVKYLSLLTNQIPIESCFVQHLVNNLNAEVVLGTITNVEEAVKWLSYTYLFVRMRINPHVYGISLEEVDLDPMLVNKRKQFIINAAMTLDRAQMLRYNERTGDLLSTNIGQTASYFYIAYESIELFNQRLKSFMKISEVLSMIASAKEFNQIKVRDEEIDELEILSREYCRVECQSPAINLNGKVNILLQTYLGRGKPNCFSLISDLIYISQNATRIARALFDMVLRRNNALMSTILLEICQMLEMTQWDFESELRQFSDVLPCEIIDIIEQRQLSFNCIQEMDTKELGTLLRNKNMGSAVKKYAMQLPYIELSEFVQPITRTILRINLELFPEFEWNDKFHGKESVDFWIWIEDPETDIIYHWEQFLITKRQVVRKETQKLVFTIPLLDPLPSEYLLHCTSDRWLGTKFTRPLTFEHFIIPTSHTLLTELLELQPLPLSAINNQVYQSLYNFTHFNPIQTQIFNCLYHTDNNVLLGAPTGSGKTLAAEIAMFRVFNEQPKAKVVYIAPLKALVQERMIDWKIALEKKLKKSVVELTGDDNPDIRAINNSSVIVTTPEKWDKVSRNKKTCKYVRQVALIILDEFHLLGETRGAVLEIIISRINFISTNSGQHTRIVALTTALSTAADLAAWLNIGKMDLYNFHPSVRPIPLEVHISGYAGRHYYPRMATMNKPIYQAIKQHSPTQPVVIFVSSRKQTRLTAFDLITYLGGEDNPKQWVCKSDYYMDQIIENIRDPNLKHCLAFGLGLHHDGLHDGDRKNVEKLFVNQQIQVIIATSTSAWGVNFPTHFVIVKGTEFYDGKLKRYVDIPITDVLQMMGQAGRPQYDNMGIALIMVHDVKKTFYQQFLNEPLPIESSLLDVLHDQINAEIVAGTIKTKQDALEYLNLTYFIQRLKKNPEYYGLHSLEESSINEFLSDLVEECINTLYSCYCVKFEERFVKSTPLGQIASNYYLKHKTIKTFRERLQGELNIEDLIKVLVDAEEFNLLPVRYNEEFLNSELDKQCPLDIGSRQYECSHTKTLILLQSHFSRLKIPCKDYIIDLQSILDQCIHILQAMIDISAEFGYLVLCLKLVQLMQMIIQARWDTDPPIITLPGLETHLIPSQELSSFSLPHLCNEAHQSYKNFEKIMLQTQLKHDKINEVYNIIIKIPNVDIQLFIQGYWSNSDKIQKILVENNKRIDILAGSKYSLVVEMKILNQKIPSRAYSPKFSKPKDIGWFMMLGSIEQWKLIALKHNIINRNRTNFSKLSFKTPTKPSYLNWTFYMMYDCYLGLDKQYEIKLNVI